MASDGDLLLRAIMASPKEDTPRLVYADWLDENAKSEPCPKCKGQLAFYRCRRCKVMFERITKYSDCDSRGCDGEPSDAVPCPTCKDFGTLPDAKAARAEFIRVQVELSVTNPVILDMATALPSRKWEANEYRRSAYLLNREQELRTTHAGKWFSFGSLGACAVWDHSPLIRWSLPPHETDAMTGNDNRGFVSEITCTPELWLTRHRDFYWHPKQKMKCKRCGGNGKAHGADRSFEWSDKVNYSKCVICWDETLKTSTGCVPADRPCPTTAQPIERVTLTDRLNIHRWIGEYGNTYGVRWIDTHDQAKGFTDERWPGVEFKMEEPPTH